MTKPNSTQLAEPEILIPVFNGYESVRRCLDSVLRYTPESCPIRILDDASTDLRLLGWLDELERQEPRVQLRRADENLGFVGNVNRGLASAQGDVIVLNSDTLITPGWVERLIGCAASDERIGIVCPLSNNATILSVPWMNEDNPIPDGLGIERFAALIAASSARRYPRLPVAVGFCMLIRQAVIRRIGLLHRAYRHGYGEECDYSLRAWEAGFEVACCDDAFVYHQGEQSFGAVPGLAKLKQRNEAVLLSRWPFYHGLIRRFCQLNPLRDVQERILAGLAQARGDQAPHLLYVLHEYHSLGGTEIHARALMTGLADDYRISLIFPGETDPYRDFQCVDEDGRWRVLAYQRALIETGPKLFGYPAALRNPSVEASFARLLAGGAVRLVHFHHLLGWGSLELPLIARRLGAAVILSLHDYFLFCPVFDLLSPQGLPCGRDCVDPEDDRCLDCLLHYPNTIEDRDELRAYLGLRQQKILAILEAAEAIVVPSGFVLQRFLSAYGPELALKVRVIPHGLPQLGSPMALRPSDSFRLGVFANLTRRKGAEHLIEAIRLLKHRRSLQVLQFGGVEPGYRQALSAAGIQMRGTYRHLDLKRLVAEVDLAVVPSVYEETFCLTIAELQALGVPVLAFAVGAIPERITDGQSGFLVEELSARALAERIQALIANPRQLRQVRTYLRQQRPKRLEDNLKDYAALYEQSLGVGARSKSDLQKVLAELQTGPEGAPLEMGYALLSSVLPDWGNGQGRHHPDLDPGLGWEKGGIEPRVLAPQSGLDSWSGARTQRRPLAYGSVSERRWLESAGRYAPPSCYGLEGTAKDLDLVLVILEPMAETGSLSRTLDSIPLPQGRLQLLVVSNSDDLPAHPRCVWLRPGPGQSVARLINLWIAEHPSDWIGWITAGDQLHPSAFDLIASWIARHPDWRFVYTDEDRIAEDGRRYRPCFKPDFDLDLLRSRDYLGGLCLIRRDAFLACGGLIPQPAVAQLDLCLKVADRFGEGAVGHIPQVLYHRADWHLEVNPDFELISKVLASHLKRRRLRARICPTSVAGIQWLDFPPSPGVQTALVLLTRSDPQAIAVTLDSIRSQLDLAEILILDFKRKGAREPLVSRAPNIRWQRAEGSLARALNRALRALKAERVLVIHDGLSAPPHAGLVFLLGLIDRPEVALVGPCILDPGGRILQGYPILGFWPLGALGQVHRGQSLAETGGLLDRHLCVQRCATVSEQAFILWRPAFIETGGFDETHYPDAWFLLDLGLRLRALGYQTLWTPHVTLVAEARGSFQLYRRRSLRDLEVAEETARLYERWLPQLARDPAYNPNLSLRRFDAAPETEIPVSWDPELGQHPRILGFPGDLTGSGHYRVIDPLSALQGKGLACTAWIDPAPSVRPPSPVELERMAPDVLLLHNALHDRHLQALALYRRYNQTRLLFSLDDLLTHLPPWNPFRQTNYPDLERRLDQALTLCDRLLVSTPMLAECYSEKHGDIRVIPNRLVRARWQGLAEKAAAMRHKAKKRRPRIGWAGAAQHQGDLEWLAPVVEALAGEAEWYFFGMCPETLRPYAAGVWPMVGFAEYPKTLASLGFDVAIAPLALHDFNRCKSNLKILEYGALGIPVICTDIEPYRMAPVERLPNRPGPWIEALRARLADLETAEQEGQQLRHWVESHWMLEDHLASWNEALVFSDKGSPEIATRGQSS